VCRQEQEFAEECIHFIFFKIHHVPIIKVYGKVSSLPDQSIELCSLLSVDLYSIILTEVELTFTVQVVKCSNAEVCTDTLRAIT